MKRSFFQAAVVSVQLYGCTTWTLTKRLKKKLDRNYTRMLRATLNKSWWQQPTRHQLYGHLPPITKTIQVRRTRHAGHCWRWKDKLISDVPQLFQFSSKVEVLIFLFTFLQIYSVVRRDSKVDNFTNFLFFFFFFLVINMRSGLLAEIRWSVCMLKSHRSLCVTFSRTGAGLCIYHLFVCSSAYLHLIDGSVEGQFITVFSILNPILTVLWFG